MALTWETFRSQIRRSILKDPDANTWDDDVLLDLCGWAQDTFCAHTALVSGTTYTPANTLAVPDNVFADLETSGFLYYQVSGRSPVPFKASIMAGFTDDSASYSVWENQIVVNGDIPDTGTMVLRYFAYYPKPVDEDSLLLIPRWSYNAVAHLIGALAQTSTGVQSANIDRWKDRREAGTPEDNALRVQQHHLLKVYETELSRFRKQDRENSYIRLLAT